MADTTNAEVQALLDDFDYASPEVAAHFRDLTAAMRERCPVLHSDRHGGHWVVTRYDDVRAVVQDWESFTSTEGVTLPKNEGAPVAIPVDLDPPLQREFRRLLNYYLTPARVRQFEPATRRLVDELIDEFIDDGTCDFVAQLGERFPAAMFLENVLGVSGEDLERLANAASTLGLNPGTPEAMEGFIEIYGWATQLLEARRGGERRDDVVDGLIHGTVMGREVTLDEAVGAILLLILGGFDTTSHLAGSIMLRLARDPDLAEHLRKHPEDLQAAIEECTRLDTSFTGITRVATTDVELQGVRIPRGDRVLVYFDSANRDEREFDDPAQFKLNRKGNRHLGFGGGPHRCAGSHLARLNLRVMFEQLLSRLTDIELVDPEAEVVYVQRITRGPKSLPLRFNRT